MKTLFTAFIVILSFGIFAQEFTVSGKVQYLSYHQGGVELPPEMMKPVVSPNEHLYIVQYFGPTEKSKIITSITTDKNGNFEAKLPSGKYGFIQHKTELGKGIYLPGMTEKKTIENDSIYPVEIEFQEIGYQNYWALNTFGPFEITNQDLSNIELTHYDISICYMCP